MHHGPPPPQTAANPFRNGAHKIMSPSAFRFRRAVGTSNPEQSVRIEFHHHHYLLSASKRCKKRGESLPPNLLLRTDNTKLLCFCCAFPPVLTLSTPSPPSSRKREGKKKKKSGGKLSAGDNNFPLTDLRSTVWRRLVSLVRYTFSR